MPVRKPRPNEICPPGYHLVRGHRRVCRSGTVTWVDAHNRKNPKRRIGVLLSENLLYLYWTSKKSFKPLGPIKGFRSGAEYDEAIQFWLSYWKEQRLALPDLDPLLIKTIIAVESSFKPDAITKIKGSSARGLMQLTDQTRRVLSGQLRDGYREVRHHLVVLSAEEALDPLLNIAAGVRWLSYKFEKIPGSAKRDAFNTIKNYHSWDNAGEEYAKKVLELYKNSR